MYNRRRWQPESAWPGIPHELLEKVIRLLNPLGRAAVRLVCSSWRSCARKAPPIPLPDGYPFLPFGRPGPGSGGSRAFFSIQCRDILRFALRAAARSAAGSPWPWIGRLESRSATSSPASSPLCHSLPCSRWRRWCSLGHPPHPAGWPPW
ncbi:hypothetical protein ACQ4PT_019815 [Festuca glaucescens]